MIDLLRYGNRQRMCSNPPDAVIFLHQGVSCLLSGFPGPVQVTSGNFSVSGGFAGRIQREFRLFGSRSAPFPWEKFQIAQKLPLKKIRIVHISSCYLQENMVFFKYFLISCERN